MKHPRIRLIVSCLGLFSVVGLSACDRSVSDAIPDGSNFDPATERPVDSFDSVRARVRNESASRADVTLRFIRDSVVVHLAFVRVLPGTATTVVSPKTVDHVELSGLSDSGEVLASRTFVFGVDFDGNTPAEYLVPDEAWSGHPVTGPNSDPSVVTSVSLIEPASDLSLTLGSTFRVRWNDTAAAPGAVVSVFLRPVDSTNMNEWIPVSPAIGASLDGTNDEVVVILEGVVPGLYEVAARIADGDTVKTSIAQGLVEVANDSSNQAPFLEILEPTIPQQVRLGDALTLRWRDVDPDDNATITFELESANRATGLAGVFTITPPIAEDPDGAAADSSTVLIHDVLPGVYDLVGTIDDGRLIGTARVRRGVLVLPEPDNDPPELSFTEPAANVRVEVGDSVLLRWTDSDDNDNARISLLLDPHPSPAGLDGNEILLVSSLGEDADGAGDRVTLGIPMGVESGFYRITGVITDGLTQVVARAPGIVEVSNPAAPPAGGGGGSVIDVGGGGGGGPGGGSGGPGGEIEPGGSTPSVSIDVLGSEEDLVVVGGESFEVVIETSDSSTVGRRRIFISNLPFGGDLRIEVTPTEFPSSKRLVTTVRTDAVPNSAWPRQFNIEIETLVDGLTDIYVAPRPLWIRQEVEIVEVEIIGEPCNAAGAVAFIQEPFSRAELLWYGGGYESGDGMSEVQFWLTSDGTVPEDGVGDSTHELIFRHFSSPNEFQVFGLAVEPVDDEMLDALRPRYPTVPNTVAPGVDPGLYYLVTVLDTEGSDRTVSAPYVEQIEFCDPGIPDSR